MNKNQAFQYAYEIYVDLWDGTSPYPQYKHEDDHVVVFSPCEYEQYIAVCVNFNEMTIKIFMRDDERDFELNVKAKIGTRTLENILVDGSLRMHWRGNDEHR